MAKNPRFRKYVEEYAQDQDAFFRDYAEVHSKMSEGGQVENLMCEIEDDREDYKRINDGFSAEVQKIV